MTKIKANNQKFKAEFKDKSFKDKVDFEKWLKAKTAYIIHFEDKGQDCLNWHIDKGGEVLHANLQASVWNGQIVDLEELKPKKNIGVMDSDNQRTKFLKFIVKKIDEIKK